MLTIADEGFVLCGGFASQNCGSSRVFPTASVHGLQQRLPADEDAPALVEQV